MRAFFFNAAMGRIILEEEKYDVRTYSYRIAKSEKKSLKRGVLKE